MKKLLNNFSKSPPPTSRLAKVVTIHVGAIIGIVYKCKRLDEGKSKALITTYESLGNNLNSEKYNLNSLEEGNTMAIYEPLHNPKLDPSKN